MTDGYVPRRPTRSELIEQNNLLKINIDLSYNNLGPNGAEILCSLLSQRENYTIVSLNLAHNSMGMGVMCVCVCVCVFILFYFFFIFV